MHRIMVKIKPSHIFNGFFETQNSTRIEQVFAKIRVNRAWRFGVYYGPINYEEALTGVYLALNAVGAFAEGEREQVAAVEKAFLLPLREKDRMRGRLNIATSV